MENTLEKKSANVSRRSNAASKYLTFQLGNEEYGLEILRVREIIGMLPITKLPKAPPYVKGVINLRGKVNPVIDTRKKFGMEQVDVTERTCIIIVEVNKGKGLAEFGIIVDSVSEVLDIQKEELEDAEEFSFGMENGYISHIAKTKTGVKILLNIDKVLENTSELQINSENTEGGK